MATGAAAAGGAVAVNRVFSKKELKQIKRDEAKAKKEVQAQFKADAILEKKQAKNAKKAKKEKKKGKKKGRAGDEGDDLEFENPLGGGFDNEPS